VYVLLTKVNRKETMAAEARVKELEDLLEKSRLALEQERQQRTNQEQELDKVRDDLQRREDQLTDSNTKLEEQRKATKQVQDKQQELMDKINSRASRDHQSRGGEFGTVYVSRERHVDKFSGVPSKDKYDAEQWCREVSRYIDTRVWDDKEKVDFILEHLLGPAREEIVYRDPSTLTSKDILGILRSVFCETDTLASLKAKFYTATQSEDETLLNYSLRLMKLLTKIEEREGKTLPDKDSSLKGQFTEGVRDEHLRQELRRLRDEEKDLKFWEFRQRARDWMGPSADETSSKGRSKDGKIRELTTRREAVESTSEDVEQTSVAKESNATKEVDKNTDILQMLMSQMVQLEQKMQDVTEYQQRGGFKRGFGYRGKRGGR